MAALNPRYLTVVTINLRLLTNNFLLKESDYDSTEPKIFDNYIKSATTLNFRSGVSPYLWVFTY